jgi:hypothetical protein
MLGAISPLPQYVSMACLLSTGYGFRAWYLVKHWGDYFVIDMLLMFYLLHGAGYFLKSP